MGKTSKQKQAEAANLQIQQQQLHQQQQAQEQYKQSLAQQNQIYGQISPFAQSAIGAGQMALQGQLTPGLENALLTPVKNQLARDYSQAGSNLVESLGQAGQYGSGLSVGPLASFQQNQAVDQSNAAANARLQGLQFGLNSGFQGANLLAGQQALANPLGYGSLAVGAGQAGVQDPSMYKRAGSGLLGSFLGAGLGAVGSYYGAKG